MSLSVFIGCLLLSAPVFGYLGDRHSRKATLSFGILLWSGAGLSSSFISPQVGALIPEQAPGIFPHRFPSWTQSLQGWGLVGCFCSIPCSGGGALPSRAERLPLGFLNRSLPLFHLPLLPVASFPLIVLGVGVGWGNSYCEGN